MIGYRQFALAVAVAFVLAGCGGGTSPASSTAGGLSTGGGTFTSNPASGSQTAGSLVLHFTLQQETVVPPSVTRLQLTGFDSGGAVVFPTRTVATASTVTLTGVPTQTTRLQIVYLAGTDPAFVGLNPVDLVAGGTQVITSPDRQSVNQVFKALQLTLPTPSAAAASSFQATCRGTLSDGSTLDETGIADWLVAASSWR